MTSLGVVVCGNLLRHVKMNDLGVWNQLDDLRSIHSKYEPQQTAT